MRWIRGFGRFWYDFIVGDDWTVAVGVVAALGLCWLGSRAELALWWLLPLAVTALLGASVHRVSRDARKRSTKPG